MTAGVLLALLGAVAFSVMNVAIRKGVRPGDRDNGVFTTVIINVLVFTTLISITVVMAGGASWSWGAVAAFMAAGLASTFVGRTLLFAGIRDAGAARAAAVKNATPVVTLVIAVAILGERIVPLAGAGIGLVLVGVFLLAGESMRRPASGAVEPGRRDIVQLALESEALAEAGELAARPAGRPGSRTTVDAGRATMLGLALSGLAAIAFGAAHALRKVGMDITPDALLGASIGAWAALAAHTATGVARGQSAMLRAAVTSRRPYFWLAGVTGTIGQICFFGALRFAPVSHVSVVFASETILTVLFAGLVAQGTERITARIVLPALLVFVGVTAIAFAR